MPQEVREEAVERAEAGKHLTKEAAERLIADRVLAALDEARQKAEAERAEAVKEAIDHLLAERQALQQKIDEAAIALDEARRTSDETFRPGPRLPGRGGWCRHQAALPASRANKAQ